jgi:glyoxylase-like metal-dependent hydrolase (beta-lactamase superfamily II)
MKVQVEPKPLHEPLSGGTAGTTVIVEPIVTGTTSFARAMMESPGGRFLTPRIAWAMFTGKEAKVVPIPVFLIRHPSAGAILVDTGLHPSIATDPEENFGRLPTRFGSPSVEPDGDAPAQLRRRGLDPGEVPIVVMTHLHLDHTSAISEFPNSTFVVSEVEWQEATEGKRPTMNGYRRIHLDFAFDYRTVDFDRGGIDSYATFGRTFDLFGDGSIRLAYTPGHTAGHMSVIARLRDRDFVIGGDVAYTLAQLEGEAPLPPRPFDAHNYRRSLQEMKLFRREFPAAIVTPGHDPKFYEGLEARYE